MRIDSAVRWIARAWGVAGTLVILAFAFGGGEGLRPTAAEAVGLLLFPVGVVAGFAIAWWREGVGGAVTVGSLALFYLWLFARSGRLSVGPYFLLLAAPGFLHAANALWLARAERPTSRPIT